jgi:hypothetical protein
MAYATVAQLKRYLGIVETTTDETVLLTELLDRAQAYINKYCRRTFEASADAVRYFDAVDDVQGRRLQLDRDLASITSIVNGDGVTVTSAQYVTAPRNAVTDGVAIYAVDLLPSASISWTYEDDSANAIAVTGRWHYPLTANVVQATIRMAAYLYRQKDNSGDLDRPFIAGQTTILPGELPDDVRRLLPAPRPTVRA